MLLYSNSPVPRLLGGLVANISPWLAGLVGVDGIGTASSLLSSVFLFWLGGELISSFTAGCWLASSLDMQCKKHSESHNYNLSPNWKEIYCRDRIAFYTHVQTCTINLIRWLGISNRVIISATFGPTWCCCRRRHNPRIHKRARIKSCINKKQYELYSTLNYIPGLLDFIFLPKQILQWYTTVCLNLLEFRERFLAKATVNCSLL